MDEAPARHPRAEAESGPARHFDEGDAYERFMGRWSRAAGEIFLDWIAPPRAARWLEIGCGSGIFTELIIERCAPAAVCAVDTSEKLIEHARRRPLARFAEFRIADAEALPFTDRAFDVVASSLLMNFVTDRPRAMAAMRRVTRPGGLVAAMVWDFAADLSPSGPMRRTLRKMGLEAPPVPGSRESTLDALADLFRGAGFDAIAATAIDVTASFPSFDDFVRAQTTSYNPLTKFIDRLGAAERAKFYRQVGAAISTSPDGRIKYSARANVIKARVQG
ncbi:MAG TPA: methyltransferase domain-containing protein [Xanthobacteraceae bacterium]|nr:methyltransferase domain-containing protein [Xanthobacteraceae bacterium]